MTNPLRVGIWAAVSSAPQATDEKESIPHQIEAGERFAEQIGGSVASVYRVDGHSREYVFWADAESDMPAYRYAREDLEAGRLDVVHCVDASRLGRDPALISQFYSLAAKHDAEVYDASMPHPLGQQSMGHRYGVAVKSVAAGEEQRMRVVRHRTGMRGRIRRRGLHPSNWPLGYTAIRNGTGETVGAEFNDAIRAVDRATEMFLSGLAYSEIARCLSQENWPTLRGGQHWHHSTVQRVMSNDTYAGLISAFGVEMDEPSAAFPARWDAPTFAAVVRERARRAGNSRYIRRGSSPYAGVARCRRCGGAMTRLRSGGYHYLRCATHAYLRNKGYPCHWNHMPEWKVTRALEGWLERYATPERIEESLAEMGGGHEEAALRESVKRSAAAVASLKRQRERISVGYAKGEIPGDMYRFNEDRLCAQLDGERNRGTDLQRQIDGLPDPAERRRMLETLHLCFWDWVQKDEPATISRLLQAAGVVAWCEDGQVVDVEW